VWEADETEPVLTVGFESAACGAMSMSAPAFVYRGMARCFQELSHSFSAQANHRSDLP